MTTSADDGEVHASALVTMKVKVPAGNNDTVVEGPVPLVLIAPGLRTSVQVPVGGNPLRTTLPVPTVQVRFVIVPIIGADGAACTVNVYVATAAEQGDPKGLFVVAVMMTVFPPSATEGV